MKNTHHSSHTDSPPANQIFRTSAREFANPVDYQHSCQSMARFADFLALRYDANPTRHSYYRQVRLIHEYGSCDPALLTEPQLRDYFLFVKLHGLFASHPSDHQGRLGFDGRALSGTAPANPLNPRPNG